MEGLLKPVTRADKVKGPNNPHFTTCFMNAVVLAMFIPYIPLFDRLFLEGATNEIKDNIRKFVIKARYGFGVFNAEPLRTLTGFEPGQQDAMQSLLALWDEVDDHTDYARTGDISYSSKNADAPTLSNTQTRFLFYNSDIGKVRVQSNAKVVTVNIADAPRRSLVKFTDLTLPAQPKRLDSNTKSFYKDVTFRIGGKTYKEWLEGAVVPTAELKRILAVTLPSFVVYEDSANMTQELFVDLYRTIRTSLYFFYSLRAIARSQGCDIVVPEGQSWEDALSSWTIPGGGFAMNDEYFVNKYLESLYLLGYSSAADRLYRRLGSEPGSFVYQHRNLLKKIASTEKWSQPLQGGKILRTTAPIIEFIKDVMVLSIARHRGAERMSTRFCPVDNCAPWRDDESFILTVGAARMKLSSVVINTSEASHSTFETHGHYRCYVLVQDEWYAYDDLLHGGLVKARYSVMQHDMETLGALYFYITEETYESRPKSGWSSDDVRAAKRLFRPRSKKRKRMRRPPPPPPPPKPYAQITLPISLSQFRERP